MRVYTSYYPMVSRHVNGNETFCAISQSVPAWFKGDIIHIPEVAPSWDLINLFKSNVISYDHFCQKYIEELKTKFGSSEKVKDAIVKKLPDALRDVVLVCWEKDVNSCHRKPLAEFAFGVEYLGEW